MNKLDNLQSFGYRKVDEHARSACSCRSLRPDYCSFAPKMGHLAVRRDAARPDLAFLHPIPSRRRCALKGAIEMSVVPQGKAIQAMYRDYREGNLLLNRQYQRKLVWTIEEKQALIDSILSGYPPPVDSASRTPRGPWQRALRDY